MAYTPEELRAIVLDIVNAGRVGTWYEQNDKSIYRGVHIKYDWQLADLENVYRNKLLLLEDYYQERAEEVKRLIQNFDYALVDFKGDIQGLREKVLRIADKWHTVKWEIEGRSRGFFNRTPVGTTYYIDLDGGNDGSDGLGTGTAWLTLEQYTTTTSRTAGDIAYVRANTDEIPGADIICDEDGWNSALIYIIGCDSVTNDPWSDGSDVKPIIDNNSGSYGLRFETDKYWQVERLSFKNSSSSSGAVFVERNVYTLLKDCDFIDNSRGVVISRRSTIHAVGCLFEDNTTAGVQSEGGKGLFETCTFDAGAGGQTYGVSASYGIDAEFIDCSFGQSNAHGTNDIYIVYIGIVTLRNCAHNASFNVGEGAVICSEDDDGTYAAGQITTRAGTITKDTGIKTGSADFSLKFEPNGNCKAYSPLSPHGGTSDLSKMKSPFVVEGTASTAITCTIPIRSLGTWGTYPINTELYIEASYYDSGADAGRSTIASTQVLSHASNWVNFTVTCTPLRDGPIYIQVYLKLYEDAGDGCYVNGEVTTS